MPQPSCRRCGTCCIKGGPSLHREDLPLVEEGRIRVQDLVCIRSGEMAYDPRRGAAVRTSGTGQNPRQGCIMGVRLL